MRLKSLRYYIWLVEAFFKKHYLLISVFFFTGFIIASFLSTFKLSLPKSEREKVIGIVGSFEISNLPLNLQEMISRGLTKPDENSNIIVDLANDFEVQDQGKKYVYHLKQNLLWQDGKKFTSKDVNYNFKDVTIDRPDDYTITYSLKDSYAPFPSLTTQPLFKPGLLGLGDYQVIKIKRNRKVLELLSLKNLKSQKEITYKFYPTETGALLAFKLGEVNTLEGIKEISNIKDLKHIKITSEFSENTFAAIFFNLKDSLFQDKTIRQALAYAIKDDIKKDNRTTGSYNSNAWFYNDNIKPYDFDLENAKKLLGKTKTSSQSGELEFTLTTIETYKKTAEEIAKCWQDLGFKVNVESVVSKPDAFQALLAGYEVPTDPDQYGLWHSTQATNITVYQSAKVDKLLEDGRKTTDINQRKQIYSDLQKAISEDVPAIFLFHPLFYTLERD